MADNLSSSDYFKKKKAVEILVRTAPSDVASPETKKKIARAFRKLAEFGDNSMKEEAVKGLVIWGGKFSGPILLRMLDDAGPFDESYIIKALGDIKYAKAATALTKRLGDWQSGRAAVGALRAMGEEAEDALLMVAPSENPENLPCGR